MKQYIADAFADELFSGNPAAVLPCSKMPDYDIMQKIAMENNYSEAAFVVKRSRGEYDFVSRCFYPKLKVLKNPVTGRAHTYLAPIWSDKLNKSIMRAKQISKRGGIMTVRLENDRVFLTGNVQLFMAGDIPFGL